MRGFVAGVIVTLALIALVGLGVLYSGSIPVAADQPPSAFESWLAGAALKARLRREAPNTPNPVAPSEASLMAGLRIYDEHCAVCHGTSAGKQAASAIARGAHPSPPQFADHGMEDDPESLTFWIVKHGIRLTAMPAWGGALEDRQIWTVALFLKHMDKLPPAVEAAWRALPPPQPDPAPMKR